jgi:bla regulator protein BlaR1
MTAWLLDTLVYTGLLIALVLLLRRPAARWFGPQIAYALWALPFLRLLLPPIVLPASAAPAETAPITATVAYEWIEVAPATAGPAPASLPSVAPVASTWQWADLAAPALSVWLAGALTFLLWRVVTYRSMRRELLADARPVGEVGKVRLVETPALAAPVAFGVLDKVIALPPRFMAWRDVAARDLAIAHELQHHRAHDLLANYAAQVLLALHWFNPIAWYGWRAMRRDQEAACDARVLAGRGRDERIIYAALIADIAAGPRLALAAPMACPVLGEASVIQRLRSLSMSEITPRRRWLGRGLVALGALALPLTASISYSTASAQASEPPAPPASPLPPGAPSAPDAPLAPAAPAAAEEQQVRTFVLRREGTDGEPVVRQFTLRRDGDAPLPPMPPSVPEFQFRAFEHGEAHDPEFEARMEEFGREMAEWAEQYAAEMDGQALAWAEAGRNAPEVVESCDPADRRATVTPNGRPRVVLCQREIRNHAVAGARAGLRGARAAIAGNREMSAEVRDEILRDLDTEIGRLEREE